MTKPLTIGGLSIEPGTEATVQLPIANLATHTPATMPVRVIRSKKPGPRLFISAALHGDEVIGVEIIRRILQTPAVRKLLRGDLILVPIVNVFGFIFQSRYLPDRRDLNRSFPGSEKGSLAARTAHLFIKEIASQCSHGIDLHSAAIHRFNLPQVRADLDHKETFALAQAFGAPVILDSELIDGSLRKAMQHHPIRMIVYEGGQALRFDEHTVLVGVRGILNVLNALEMIQAETGFTPEEYSAVCHESSWLRANRSGIFRTHAVLGNHVKKGDSLGAIADPFGENETNVMAHKTGILIGQSQIPIVNEGDGLFHIASTKPTKARGGVRITEEERAAIRQNLSIGPDRLE